MYVFHVMVDVMFGHVQWHPRLGATDPTVRTPGLQLVALHRLLGRCAGPKKAVKGR